MSNIVVGLISAILLIAAGLLAANLFGPAVMQSREAARTADYIGQTAQLRKAAEDYTAAGNALTLDGTVDPIDRLSTSSTLKGAPRGGRTPWALSTEAQALVMQAEGAAAAALASCRKARAAAGIPSPDDVKKCDGSDGALSKNDPCCVG